MTIPIRELSPGAQYGRYTPADGSGPFSIAEALDDLRSGSFTSAITITSDDSNAVPLTLISTNADALQGPSIILKRLSDSPAVSDSNGAIFWQGEDSTDTVTNYAGVKNTITDPTNGSEDGVLDFYTSVAGTFAFRLRLGGGLMVGLASDLGLGGISATAAISAYNTTAIPAAGAGNIGFKATSTANFGVFFGSGAPTLSAAKGSLYLRSDGSTTNDRAYINTDGGTTWTALTTAA